MSTTELTGHVTTMGMGTERPYEEFTEVKVAFLIDSIYLLIVVCLGMLGNFLSFMTLVFTALRTTSTSIYMAAIAVLDSIILILGLCFLLRKYIGKTELYLLNDWACGFHNFLFYFSIHFDVWLILAMTADRFIVVRFPLKAQSWSTPKSALKVISGIGFFSFALNFQILFTRRLMPSGKPEDPLECWYPDKDVDFFIRKIYTWIDASLYSFIPFLSLLSLNALIIRELRRSRQFGKQFMDNRHGQVVPKANSKNVVVNEGDTSGNDVNTSNTDVSLNDMRITVTGDKTEDLQQTFTITDRQTDQGKKSSRRSEKQGSKKHASASTNITAMLLWVSFTFLVLTSPVVIVLLYERYYWLPSTNTERARASLTHAFVDNLMYTNHAINFLLYCLSGRRFRQELTSILTRFCRRH